MRLVEHLNKHPCEYIQLAEKTVCRNLSHMETFFQDVIDRGGEGIILRDSLCPLEPGRSRGYLKHKVCSPLEHFCVFTTLLTLIQQIEIQRCGSQSCK